MGGNACIKSLSRRGDTTVCVTAEVSNESGSERVEFVILDELLAELDPQIGAISENLLCELDRLSDVSAAYLSACSSLAYTQSSLKALYRKLIGKGFSKDSSLEATEIVRLRGVVDEESVAVRRAEIMLAKLWGRSRILQKLREEGFPDSAMCGVYLLLDSVDFSLNCARVIEKKYAPLPTERRDREKMYAALMRNGYSSSEIKEAIAHISER